MTGRGLFLIFFLACPGLVAQHALPDSILQKNPSAVLDSALIDRLNETANGYLKTSPDKAREIVSYVIEAAPTIKYTRGYARALTVMGNAYWTEGIYEFAQNYYLLAARQYAMIRDSVGLGRIYNNIGEVYKKLNDYPKALEYLERSASVKKNDPSTEATTLYNIGELYVLLKNSEKATTYLNRSLAIGKRQNNQRVIAFNYWSFGALHALKKEYDEALRFYFMAEEIWKKIGDLRSLIQTYQEIAELYRLQAKYDEAERFLRDAIRLSGQIKVADLQVNNYLRFAKLDSARGNFSSAFRYLSRHNALKDSVYNLLKSEQIARVQVIYETEVREMENTQLRADTKVKESLLRTQRRTLIGISGGLIIVGILAWFLFMQRRKIQTQKEAIEVQAVALQKLNESLQELNKNLEARIAERTDQLTVQNQRLTEYTFINAHKLRAPVASILGLINLMHQVTPQEREVLFNHLKTCGEQLDNIIRDLSKSLEGAIVSDKK